MAPAPANSAHRALPGSANLANLLPTGTVFAFQAIIPSISNNGRCEMAHKAMTLSAIILCSLACFLSSFTDSFVGDDGKLYYGIATPKGLRVFNDEPDDGLDLEENSEKKDELDLEKNPEKKDELEKNPEKKDELEKNPEKKDELEKNTEKKDELGKYKLSAIDFVHAFCSLTLFLVMACSSFDVQSCFFPEIGPNGDALVTNLPLLAGFLASGLFMLFPTKRKGIGYADRGNRKEQKQTG